MKIMPDFLLTSGLSLLGYGLWLYSEPLAYSVVGALLMIGGILSGRPKK